MVRSTGQRVLPAVLLDHGFTFEYETVEAAFAAIYARGDVASPQL